MANSDRDGARAAWRGSATFEDLCELGARFLEGDLPFFPGWMAADIDEETDDFVPVLAGMCRGGFLTCASQPGHGPRVEHDGQSWRRRAFVSGFASEVVASRIAGQFAGHGLMLRSFGANESGHPGVALPVGLRGETPFLFAGGPAGPEELELFAEVLAPAALADLGRTRYVSAIDPEWDARELLWDRLARAVQTE